MMTHAHTKRRDKVFGAGRPVPLDRNQKARITTLARALMRRTEEGRAYGKVSAKAYQVLMALLYQFHNSKSGLCFPSYDSIASAAGCARSTVAEAIRALEAAGLLTWVNRLKRVRELSRGLDGQNAPNGRTRVLRTSNGYRLIDPGTEKNQGNIAVSSKSENPARTKFQVLFKSISPVKKVAAAVTPTEKRLTERKSGAPSEHSDLERALARLQANLRGRMA